MDYANLKVRMLLFFKIIAIIFYFLDAGYHCQVNKDSINIKHLESAYEIDTFEKNLFVVIFLYKFL